MEAKTKTKLSTNLPQSITPEEYEKLMQDYLLLRNNQLLTNEQSFRAETLNNQQEMKESLKQIDILIRKIIDGINQLGSILSKDSSQESEGEEPEEEEEVESEEVEGEPEEEEESEEERQLKEDMPLPPKKMVGRPRKY